MISIFTFFFRACKTFEQMLIFGSSVFEKAKQCFMNFFALNAIRILANCIISPENYSFEIFILPFRTTESEKLNFVKG